MHRPTLGILTLALAAGGLTWWLWPGSAGDISGQVVVRASLILGALWVGLPAIRRAPRWLLVTIGVVALVLIARPQFLIWGVLGGLVIGILAGPARTARR